MKRFLLLAFAAVVMAAGCSKYDDTDLQNRVGSLENRVAKLEELCKQLNSDISSLQTIVTALQNNDYVTGVIPVTKNGEAVGYTITFSKSSPITIYHGENGNNGKDGYTPQIGVRQDTDGIWYWTLDGSWLTDNNGNKIKAEGRDGADGKDGKDGENSNGGQNGADGKDGVDGKDGADGKDGVDGKDGITPRLKIEDGWWWVSYDNEQSWEKLGKAIGNDGSDGENGEDGKDGQNGGDSIFKSVQETETEVIFTLADGTEIRIQKGGQSATAELDITFGNTDSINALPDSTYEITYTIIGADESTIIDVVAQDYYKAYVEAHDYASGKIVVTTPSADLAASRVLVFVSRGKETIMRILNFVESVIIVSTDTIEVEAEGGTETIDVETNITYIVEIPDSDRSWISVADTRTATHTEKLTFTISENPNTTYRYSTVTLTDESGYVGQKILFAQKASGYKTVHVETAGTLESYISENEKNTLVGLKITGKINTFDYDFMRSMPALKQVDIAQIDNTTIPASCFSYSSVETVILPLNLTAIPERAFYQSKLTSINIPASVESIGDHAFYNCQSIKGDLIIPDAVTAIGKYSFCNCTFDGTLSLGKGLLTIGTSAFSNCKNFIGDLILPENVTTISNYAFEFCSGFTGNLIIPENVTTISDCAFQYCSGFTGNLIISDSVETIGRYTFQDCRNFSGYLVIGSSVKSIGSQSFWSSSTGNISFSKVYCKPETPPSGTGFTRIYNNSIFIILYVPIGCKDAYKSNYDWSDFSTIEEVEF